MTMALRWLVLGLPAVVALQSQPFQTSIMGSAADQEASVQGLQATSSNRSNGDIIDKIVFLKLHNVGSSTMTGILHRYCEFHSKTCYVLPGRLVPGLGIRRPTLSKEDIRGQLPVFKSPNVPPLDIFAEHQVMEPTLLDDLVPGNFKISFFRDPLDRHMSGLRHFADYNKTSGIFEELTQSLQQNIEVHDCSFPVMSTQIMPDQVDELDYVMLQEEYDTSLMMLRRTLGWPMFDMMYRSIKSEHTEAVLNASDTFLAYISQPAESLNEATNSYLQHCAGQTEQALYSAAKAKFQHQWESFTAEEQQQIQEDTATFLAAKASLEACCEAHPADTYCVGAVEDSIEWMERYQSQGYFYTSRRMNGETVETPITQESTCMSVVKAALFAKR
mmetsp:Transcript_48600/g.89547  ORF Transcript_48600/g.89547 Transcript_48600/m.89547 type:complete len:388 (+) Transcript_48600:77-1240(+)